MHMQKDQEEESKTDRQNMRRWQRQREERQKKERVEFMFIYNVSYFNFIDVLNIYLFN